MWSKLFFLYLLFQLHSFSQAKRTKRPYNYACEADQYMCKNHHCVSKGEYCDGIDHCGDNSDELYCKMGYDAALIYPEFTCDDSPSSSKLIPRAWVCDGVRDCSSGYDEARCHDVRPLFDDVEKINGSISARENATHWMLNQHHHDKEIGKVGIDSLRIAVILSMVTSSYFDGTNATGNEISHEVENLGLSSLMRDKMEPMSMNELALLINALIVTCSNPRDFHGLNLVAKLRRQVDSNGGYINPLVPLALCNAEDKMTKKDVEKLKHVVDTKKKTSWLSTQALAVMALACIGKVPHSSVSHWLVSDRNSRLKSHQANDGGFENAYTTALVMQALFASGLEDEPGWNMTKAVKYLVDHHEDDGSYGDILTTYFVLPALYYKSLADISSEHCHHNSTPREAVTVINDLSLKVGKKIRVKYTLAVGDKTGLHWSLRLRVVENITLFDVMKLANDIDENFKYTLIDFKPHVYKIGRYHDDSENDKYWFLYEANEIGHDKTLLNLSPLDVIPKDGEEYIMWFRSGHWVHD